MLGTLDPDTRHVLDVASVKTGINLVNRVSQGGHSTSVSESAGTHSGNGAADILTNGLTGAQILSILAAIRSQPNATAWYRTVGFSVNHIHMIVYTSGMSASALGQWKSYLAGGDGLAGNGKDTGPRDAALLAQAAKLTGVSADGIGTAQNVVSLTALANPDTWIRVVKVILGTAFLTIALINITGLTGGTIGKVAQWGK